MCSQWGHADSGGAHVRAGLLRRLPGVPGAQVPAAPGPGPPVRAEGSAGHDGAGRRLRGGGPRAAAGPRTRVRGVPRHQSHGVRLDPLLASVLQF